MGLRAQGSTEYLVLLAAALLIALAVAGILAYYPGNSEDAKRAQSDIYWRKAYPIAVLESSAAITDCTSEGCPDHQDSAALIVKNLANERVIIRGMKLSGQGGNELGSPPAAGDVLDRYGNYLCDESTNLIRNCSIALPPGKEMYLQPTGGYGVFCNGDGGSLTRGSLNSLRKLGEATLGIYYTLNNNGGAVGLETSNITLYLLCSDYWTCSTPQECIDRYGAGNLYCGTGIPGDGKPGGCFQSDAPPPP